MKVIAVVSAKGGVGKTTLAANLASVLATSGRRVIALDLDPQNALRLHFGVPLDSIDGLSRASLSGDAWQRIMFDGVDGVNVLPYGAVVEDDRAASKRMSITSRSGSCNRSARLDSMPQTSWSSTRRRVRPSIRAPHCARRPSR